MKNFILWLMTLLILTSGTKAETEKLQYKKITNSSLFPHIDSKQYIAISGSSLGVIYRDINKIKRKFYISLKYSEISSAKVVKTEEILVTKDSRIRPMNSSLVYVKEVPHIVVLLRRGYSHFYRNNSNWLQEPIDLPEQATKQRLLHHSVTVSSDQKMHLFFRTRGNRNIKFFHGIYHSKKWEITQLPEIHPGDLRKVFSFLIDKTGEIHIAYNFDRHLYYAKTQGKKKWHRQIVIKRKNFDTEAAWSASLAIDKQGQPFIASTYIQRVGTGSFRFCHLYWNVRKANKWSSKPLVKASAGYRGTDGTQYTGTSPVVVVDAKKHFHIAFTDMASWHNSQGANDHSEGQLRHMFFTGSKWHKAIVYRQKGQSQQKNMIREFLYPTMIISKDGKTLHFMGMERITKSFSVRYDRNAQSHHRLIYIRAQH